MDIMDVHTRFAFHPASDPHTRQAHENVRNHCLHLANQLNNLVPEGREKSTMMTKLEEAMMWANAGIARAPAKERLRAERAACEATGPDQRL